MNSRSLRAALCLGLAAGAAGAATLPADVIGSWQTEPAAQPTPDGGTAYLRMTTRFTEDEQALVVAVFADATLEIQLFEYASGGPWDRQDDPTVPAGAMAINLVNDYSLVTIFADIPDLWAGIGLSDCPLVVGEAVDITDCVNGPPFGVTGCVDLDIVMVDQDGQRLRYGGGDVDRCLVRPTELATEAFFRVE